VATYAQWIGSNCCSADPSSAKGISGQVFSVDKAFNVIIAYANCNHEPDADYPDKFEPQPGPNGWCS
jgi:hypothetical protein